jgi:U3 small nucleolar ribonucleoprotein protein IMP4
LILLTSSRRPTEAIRTLCKDLANVLPQAVRVNRGKMSLDGVAENAIELEADRVIIVNQWHGGPGKINFFHAASTGLKPVPPIMVVAGVKFRREFKEGTRRIKSSIITVEPEDSSELQKIAYHLSQFLGLPVFPADEASGKNSVSLRLSFGNSRSPQISFLQLQRMVEVGPQVALSKLVWEVSK